MVWIPVTFEMSLGALADNDVIIDDVLGGPLTEDFYWVAAKLKWSLRNATPGEGPIEVGLSHGDYTAAEVEENLEVDFLGPGSKIEQEQARRLVRRVGVYDVVTAEEKLENGIAVRTGCKFVIENGQNPQVWAHNLAGQTLTTGAIVVGTGHLYGRWIL